MTLFFDFPSNKIKNVHVSIVFLARLYKSTGRTYRTHHGVGVSISQNVKSFWLKF